MVSFIATLSIFIISIQKVKLDFRSPKFGSKANDSNETLSYEFTCTMYELPAGGFLDFYVNQRSTDTLRFYNNTCYNKFSKCSDDICSCSFKDYTFRWRHNASKANSVNTFVVEMKFIVYKLGKVKSSLARTYNKTAIMDIDSNWHTLGVPNDDVNRKGTSRNGLSDTDTLLVYITCFVFGGVMGIVTMLCMVKVKRSGCCLKYAVVSEENTPMKPVQLNSTNTCIPNKQNEGFT